MEPEAHSTPSGPRIQHRLSPRQKSEPRGGGGLRLPSGEQSERSRANRRSYLPGIICVQMFPSPLRCRGGATVWKCLK
ncbi:unnamed protein product [Arctogadus glacialis]